MPSTLPVSAAAGEFRGRLRVGYTVAFHELLFQEREFYPPVPRRVPEDQPPESQNYAIIRQVPRTFPERSFPGYFFQEPECPGLRTNL
jgi:hypothetical protein